jgi:hypothetical protein
LWKIFTRFGRVLINFYQAVAEARLQREMIVAERYRNRYLRELGASLRSKISSKLR